MWWNQTLKNTIVDYPDGSRSIRPADGDIFRYKGSTYKWDDFLDKWVDERGECFTANSKGKSCTCGSWVSGKYARHSKWCNDYVDESNIKVPFDDFKKDGK